MNEIFKDSNNVFLKRNYTGYITDPIPTDIVGEFELSLSVSPDSSMGYLLVEPGTAKEETIFYHRSSGSTVWFYQVNRSANYSHDDNSQVLLVNSIDYMNYILGQTEEQLFLYQIDDSNLVIKGGKFYIASQMVTLSDLDTSLGLLGKSLFNNSTNYIYVDTENLDFLITDSVNNDYFLVATLHVNGGGVIDSISKIKTKHIGTIGQTGHQGEQGPPGPQGNPGNPGVDGAEVEIRNNGTYIQWKYDNEVSWTNLVSVASITGADGVDGKEVELSKQSNAISYRYVGGTTWTPIVYLDEIKGPQGDIGNTGETVNINDNQVIGGTTTTDDLNKTVTVTNPDGTYTEYKEDGIYYYNSDDELIAKDSRVGIYVDGVITYTGLTVNGNEETIQVESGNIAYVNKNNIFKKENVNTFEGTVIFKGGISHPFHTIDLGSSSIINFDASLGENQKIVNMTTSGAKTLNISNVFPGRTYGLAINNRTGGNVTIVKGTVNSNGITDMHSLGGQVSTQTMATGSAHILFMYTSENGIHISYLKSGPF